MLPSAVVASYRKDSVWIIELHGCFTYYDLPELTAATARGLGAQDGPIVFELRHLSACDSPLLNHLLATLRLRHVVLAHVPWALKRLMEVTGTLDAFETTGDSASVVA
ncbi:STAS domain-containing protein [Streptomyces sp. NPDC001941]|uniref:STAS domain-containing protein n=1 Tax=Streptomyces sp. NPDC001941 TaxID=3154659 RepID=UPI00333237A9